MGCRCRSILFASFLIQVSILTTYSIFQLSIYSRKMVLFNGFGEYSSELENISGKPAERLHIHVNNSNKFSPGEMEGALRKSNKVNVTGTHKLDNHFLICPNPLGRLGNLMFEFAASLGIASQLRYHHVIKPTHPLLKYFDIKQVIRAKLDNLMTIREQQWRNKNWRENKTYLSHNLTLSGHYQNWKYFENVFSEVRKVFTIRQNFMNEAKIFLETKTPKFKTLIGVHVRRGDFMTKTSVREGRVVADMRYINKSMDFYRKRYKDVFFVVVSDDKKWCRDNIKGNDVILSSFGEAILDMAILSMCNHTIITAGSFSWWGGWLSGGTVVYLKDFPRRGSPLDGPSVVREEYYFPDWIGMGNA